MVEELGNAVENFRRGQLVLAPFMWADGTCTACRKGLPTSCADGAMWGGSSDGGQGEAVRVPYADATLIALPMTAEDERLPSVLALADVMSTGHYAIGNAGTGPGSTVAVIGDGAVGLCAVLAARAAGAAEILLLSRHELRARVGQKFGATETVPDRGADAVARVRELTAGHGVDAVVDCVGTQEAMDTAVGAVRDGGTVALVGAPHAALPGAEQVFLRNLKITGGLAPARVIIPRLIDRVLDGRIDSSPVFDLTVGLEAVPEAYRQMDNRTAIKALIRIS